MEPWKNAEENLAIHGRVMILLDASCLGKINKLRLAEAFSSSTDFTVTLKYTLFNTQASALLKRQLLIEIRFFLSAPLVFLPF